MTHAFKVTAAACDKKSASSTTMIMSLKTESFFQIRNFINVTSSDNQKNKDQTSKIASINNINFQMIHDFNFTNTDLNLSTSMILIISDSSVSEQLICLKMLIIILNVSDSRMTTKTQLHYQHSFKIIFHITNSINMKDSICSSRNLLSQEIQNETENYNLNMNICIFDNKN